MRIQANTSPSVASELVEAIRSFPLEREVEHCGTKFVISPFDLYASCPRCGSQIKVRAFSAGCEIEDVFDAVFEWLNQPGALDLVRRRQQALAADDDNGQ